MGPEFSFTPHSPTQGTLKMSQIMLFAGLIQSQMPLFFIYVAYIVSMSKPTIMGSVDLGKKFPFFFLGLGHFVVFFLRKIKLFAIT